MTVKSGSGSSGAAKAKAVVVASTPTIGTVPSGVSTVLSGSSIGTGAASATPLAASKPVVGLRLKIQTMLAGIQTMLPAGASLPSVQATSLTVTGMVSELQSALAAYSAVDQVETQLTQTRASLKGDIPGMKAYLSEVKQALTTFYGKESPTLAHFGLTPAKAAKKLSPSAEVVRAAKAQGTRAIRHTMGKVQKAALKFQGQVGVTTTVTGPGSAAAAPSGTPAGQAAATPATASTSAPSAVPASQPAQPVTAAVAPAATPGSPPGAPQA